MKRFHLCMKDLQEGKALASYPGSRRAAKSLGTRLCMAMCTANISSFPPSPFPPPLPPLPPLPLPLPPPPPLLFFPFRGGRSRSRLQQLVDWCGGQLFSGCLIFDECHKAKNFVPGKEKRSTKIALAVTTIQRWGVERM